MPPGDVSISFISTIFTTPQAGDTIKATSSTASSMHAQAGMQVKTSILRTPRTQGLVSCKELDLIDVDLTGGMRFTLSPV